MENNRDISELIVAKIYGELSSEEEKEFSELIKDEENREEYIQLRNIHSSVKQTPKFSEQHKKSVYVRLKAQNNRKKKIRISLSVAASILVVISLSTVMIFTRPTSTNTSLSQNLDKITNIDRNKAYLVLSNGNRIELKTSKNTQEKVDHSAKITLKDSSLIYTRLQKGKENISEKMNTLVVPRGGEYRLILSDGTKVWLNSETTLKYPVSFNKDRRQVELNGEAFFSVAKDTLHPFIVKMKESSVKVLGTEFNVSAYPDRNEEAVLVEGKVSFASKGKNKILKPGERAISEKGKIVVSKVDTKYYTSWKDGIFYFNNIRLEELIEKLSRWYDVEFFFLNEEIKNLHFTGAVEKDRSIKFVLDFISNITHVDFRVKGKGIVVQYKKESRKNW